MSLQRQRSAGAGVGRRAVALLAVTVFFTTAALAHVWVRLQVVRLGYQISQETDREKRLQQAHRKLQVERALLRNPERLERLARERLNLTTPAPSSIHVLKTKRPRRGSTPVAEGGGAP
ncbi:MAG: cell division protein FtsL [bacterium]